MVNQEPSRDEEIHAIRKEYKFFYQILGGGLVVGIGVVIGAILFSGSTDRTSYLTNLYTSILSIAVTVFVIDLLNRRRDEQRELKMEKQRLTRQLGSRVNTEALRAAEEFWEHEWIKDGTLREARLVGANLQGARFTMGELQGIDFSTANLQEASFVWANLENSLFAVTDLRQAKLQWANLKGANLWAAKLQGADLLRANLQEVKLIDAQFDEDTVLPDSNKWGADTDMNRFTDPQHPQFWRSDDPLSPAFKEK